jgi:hypothetical protein
VARPLTTAIIAEAHEGVVGGQFFANLTLHKIQTALYWWPTMIKKMYLYCKSCDICQRIGPNISKGVHPMNPLMPTEVFQRWSLVFMGPIEPPAGHTKNCYIIMATDYTTKWIEARALKDNTAKSTTKFLYEKIIMKFGCPVELIND